MDILNVSHFFVSFYSASASKQGLGKVFIEETIKTAKLKKFDAVQCMALSFYTQKICRQIGFEEIVSIRYENYEQDGVKLFDAATMAEHQEGILFALKF